MIARKDALRWIAASAVLLAGCAATRQYPAPPLQSPGQFVNVDDRPVESSIAPSSATVPPNDRASRHVLALSGGGMNGAYTVGVLKGWTESGYRPSFDVVTGISTGSLVAPFAFLGPQYDAEAERLYTSTRQENIYRLRMFFSDSLATAAPLEQLISNTVTPEVLRQIGEAHKQGRRLYVGTTNLDTKRLIVWNMGAIAARNTPESRTLFQKVLLASCSVPGLLPPVPIDVEIDGKNYTEMHVDGSVAACVFLQPGMVGVQPNASVRPNAAPLTIHIIMAGKLHLQPRPAELGLFSIAGESLSAVLQAKTDDELTQLFILARYVNADYRLAGVPDDFPMPSDSMSFDPQAMRALFDVGYRGGKDGSAWRSFPPALEPQRFAAARTGTTFATAGGTRLPQTWKPEDLRISLGPDSEPAKH